MIEILEINNCNHYFIKINGFNTCKKCGFVNERVFANTSFNISDNKYYNIRGFKQFTKINDSLEYNDSLGSHIDYLNSKLLRDSKGKLLTSKIQQKYIRLKKQNYYSFNIKNTDIRINSILKNICSQLHISKIIRKKSYNDYLILKKKIKIPNKVICIFQCLSYNCKLYNTSISIKELIETIQENGHRINSHLLIQANLKYNSFLNNKNIIKKPIEYISKFISFFRNNSKSIIKQLKFKEILYYKSFENYIFQLEKIVKTIMNKLSFQSIKNGFNPFYYTASIFYFANLLLSIKNNHKKFISQKFLSQITNVSDYTIRDLYFKYLKKYLPKR